MATHSSRESNCDPRSTFSISTLSQRFLPRPRLLAGLLALSLSSSLLADDWPQWMGPQRDGIWRETEILEKFPEGGPLVRWRTTVQAGYCGPAVANGRVYLMDRLAGKIPPRQRGEPVNTVVPGNERVLCLEAASGKVLWEQAYDCGYSIDYPKGPRATPLVSEGQVFTLGAMGDLRCHDASGGKLIWSRNFVADFKADPPTWGWSAHPLLEGNLLICTVGGEGSAVVAFDRNTGKEVWRALTAKEVCYAPPMIYELAGQRQLIIWHADGLAALNPQTGEAYWTSPYPVGGRPQRPEVIIAAPRALGNRLFFTSFYQGALMLEVKPDPLRAEQVWNRRSRKMGTLDEGLHTVLSTPVIQDGYIYGQCGMGELRCLDAATGDRKWESLALVGGEQAFFGNAFIVAHADRHFFFTDQGELVLGRLSPEGFTEVDRAKLLEPLESTRGRTVVWCHPAFANRSMYAHNGRDMICVSLARS